MTRALIGIAATDGSIAAVYVHRTSGPDLMAATIFDLYGSAEARAWLVEVAHSFGGLAAMSAPCPADQGIAYDGERAFPDRAAFTTYLREQIFEHGYLWDDGWLYLDAMPHDDPAVPEDTPADAWPPQVYADWVALA